MEQQYMIINIYLRLLDNGFDAMSNPNSNNVDYVAWCWKAGDHDDNLPQINTEGTIDSTVSVNDAAGFSIVKYTGNNTSGATIGTGLSSAPELMIVKRLDTTSDWDVYTSATGATKYLILDTDQSALTASNIWNNTAPSSTVFTVGNHSSVNASGGKYIAYLWYSVSGHSKIGSYSGTGGSISAIDVGFEPRFVMVKKTNVSGGNWAIFDNLRSGTSLHQLDANDSHAEYDNQGLTFTSTGFQPRQSVGSDQNVSGATFVYMAFK